MENYKGEDEDKATNKSFGHGLGGNTVYGI